MIHPTADVSPQASIGAGTQVWRQAQVHEGAVVGADCLMGKGVYVDIGVAIGSPVKIQSGAMLYHGVTQLADPNVLVIVRPWLPNERLKALDSQLAALGKDACPVSGASGRPVVFKLWHAPELAHLCP